MIEAKIKNKGSIEEKKARGHIQIMPYPNDKVNQTAASFKVFSFTG